MSSLAPAAFRFRPLFNWRWGCIFRQMGPAQRVLFLWRNANAVVIGPGPEPLEGVQHPAHGRGRG